MLVKYSNSEYGHVREVIEMPDGMTYATLDNPPHTLDKRFRLHDRVSLLPLTKPEKSLGRTVTHYVREVEEIVIQRITMCLPATTGICDYCGDDREWIIMIPSPGEASWEAMNRCDPCRTRGA